MQALYLHASRIATALQSELSQLETTNDQPSVITNDAASLLGQCTASLSAFQRTIDDYEQMAKRELVREKREKAEGCAEDAVSRPSQSLTRLHRRIDKFREDYASIRKQLDRLKQKHATEVLNPSIRSPGLTHTPTGRLCQPTGPPPTLGIHLFDPVDPVRLVGEKAAPCLTSPARRITLYHSITDSDTSTGSGKDLWIESRRRIGRIIVPSFDRRRTRSIYRSGTGRPVRSVDAEGCHEGCAEEATIDRQHARHVEVDDPVHRKAE